jgi:hypothetical protein
LVIFMIHKGIFALMKINAGKQPVCARTANILPGA